MQDRQIIQLDTNAAVILILVIVIAMVLVRSIPAQLLPAAIAPISTPAIPTTAPVYYMPPQTYSAPISTLVPVVYTNDDHRICLFVVNCN